MVIDTCLASARAVMNLPRRMVRVAVVCDVLGTSLTAALLGVVVAGTVEVDVDVVEELDDVVEEVDVVVVVVVVGAMFSVPTETAVV